MNPATGLGATAFLALVLGVGAQSGPADKVATGTTWEGTFKFIKYAAVGKKGEVFGTDLQLKITARDGKDFDGEFWLDNGKYGMQVRGIVTDAGKIAFKFTKIIKGDWEQSIVGIATVQGTIKGNTIVGKYEKRGNMYTTGDLTVKLVPKKQP